jgi:ligand-binding SRPBCC domain-containing protein
MRFCFEHTVPAPRETVFWFFQNPARLAVLHAGWSTLRLLHHEGHVRVGAETWVELTIAGVIPMVLGFRHMLFEPPGRFGEEAIHGAFKRFIHIHEFLARGEQTTVRDLLEVCLPWRFGGEAVMRRVVAPDIERMFHRRAQVLTRLVNDGFLAEFAPRLAEPEGTI